jgi:hypothetical protein
MRSIVYINLEKMNMLQTLLGQDCALQGLQSWERSKKNGEGGHGITLQTVVTTGTDMLDCFSGNYWAHLEKVYVLGV